jgi:NAD(P)-dependent dehydrogenase (short-subunit alcohol dehydrogenase family)
MFSWVQNMLCFAFNMWLEFESYLYDGLCYDEHSKDPSSHFFGNFGRNHQEEKSGKHFKFAWLLWLPTFGLSFLIGLYGLYRLTRFSEKSFWGSMKTAECVAKDVNLTGKVAIVTGASDGLGKETTKVLLKQGACVIMGVRDREKGDEARKCLIDYLTSNNYQPLHTLEKRIIILSLDLSSLQSVRDFVTNFNKLGLPLHYLINNGGIMATDHYELSKDGIENQFQVNYLSHYYLTRLLTPNLQQTPNSRIINLSSIAHNAAPQPFSEWINQHCLMPQGPLKDEYSSQGFTEYGISKACMILFAREYQKRNSKIMSVSVHPGDVDTKLWNENKWFKRFRYSFLKFLKLFPGEFKTVEQGAGTIMYCIVTPRDEMENGYYYRDCSCAQDHLRKDLLNDQQDGQLWNLSENLIKKAGFDFDL